MPQVSPLHPSFRAPGLNSSSFPESSRVQLSLSRPVDDVSRATPFRVFWLYRRLSYGQTRSLIFQRYLLRSAECPRLCLACLADDVSPSILGHRILRLWPAIELRVSSPLISFSVSGCSAPGVPETRAPPAPLPMSPRASPGTTSSGCVDGECPGRPELSCPSALPIGGSPGSPGFRAFRQFRIRICGLPRFCGYGWVNDVSPLSLELCILGLSCKPFPGCPRFMRPLAVPRMNLQAQSGRAIPA